MSAGVGKGPGIGWSCVQPKYSWEANLYAIRWFALTEVEGSNNGNNNIANYVNIFECVRVKSLRSISSRIIQMLQVYARAYRLYVVTYKICQMLHSWDKLLLASSSTEIHRDSGIIVRSSGK